MKEFKSGKNLKRNLILAAVLFFVCGAAYLNWSFNNKWGRADSAMARAEDAMTAALEKDYSITPASGIDESAEYFAQARLTRQESRDAAMALLETAACAETASQEVIDSAMSEITAMASWSMIESQIENELLAKEFADCVVYLAANGCTIAVPAPTEGLAEADVARVTETVLSTTGLEASQINIIEVKNY